MGEFLHGHNLRWTMNGGVIVEMLGGMELNSMTIWFF